MSYTGIPSKRGLSIYIATALIFSALCWLVAQHLAAQAGVLLPTSENFFALRANGYQSSQHLWIAVLFQLAVYGPAFAAIIAVTVESGKAGLIKLGRRVFGWRIHWMWYLAAALLAIGVALAPSLVAWLTQLVGDQPLFASVPVTFMLALLGTQLLTSGLGEEVGWRGYLLPRLLAIMPGEKALWICGITWAVWHYPFVISLFLVNMADLTPAAKLVAIPASLAGFTITIIGAGFLHAWLTNNTQSVLPSILFHALSNTCTVIFGASTLAAGPLAILPGIAPWIAVFIIQKRYGKDAFLPKPIGSACEGES